MAKKSVNMSIDRDVLEKVEELEGEGTREFNLSKIAEEAIREEINRPDYYFWNDNQHRIDGEATKAYEFGVIAAYGDEEDYGTQLDSPDAGDFIIGFQEQTGAMGFSIVLEDSYRTISKGADNRVTEHLPEFHRRVKWIATIDKSEAVEINTIRQLLDYGKKYSPRGVTSKLRKSSDKVSLLKDVIKGRSW
jgi:hypothetical protein